jgi:hypothetical protein
MAAMVFSPEICSQQRYRRWFPGSALLTTSAPVTSAAVRGAPTTGRRRWATAAPGCRKAGDAALLDDSVGYVRFYDRFCDVIRLTLISLMWFSIGCRTVICDTLQPKEVNCPALPNWPSCTS